MYAVLSNVGAAPLPSNYGMTMPRSIVKIFSIVVDNVRSSFNKHKMASLSMTNELQSLCLIMMSTEVVLEGMGGDRSLEFLVRSSQAN